MSDERRTAARALHEQALAMQTDLQEADKFFGEALRHCPEDAEIWFHRGRTHEQHGRLEEAVRYYEQARSRAHGNEEYSAAWRQASQQLQQQRVKGRLKKLFDRKDDTAAAAPQADAWSPRPEAPIPLPPLMTVSGIEPAPSALPDSLRAMPAAPAELPTVVVDEGQQQPPLRDEETVIFNEDSLGPGPGEAASSQSPGQLHTAQTHVFEGEAPSEPRTEKGSTVCIEAPVTLEPPPVRPSPNQLHQARTYIKEGTAAKEEKPAENVHTTMMLDGDLAAELAAEGYVPPSQGAPPATADAASGPEEPEAPAGPGERAAEPAAPEEAGTESDEAAVGAEEAAETMTMSGNDLEQMKAEWARMAAEEATAEQQPESPGVEPLLDLLDRGRPEVVLDQLHGEPPPELQPDEEVALEALAHLALAERHSRADPRPPGELGERMRYARRLLGLRSHG